MKICLVTAFPPSQGGLSEYGYHIARELQHNPFISLTILADEVSSPPNEVDGFSVLRCWSPDRPASIIRLLATLRDLQPDVVWFNLLFSTFGRKPLNAFAGLMTPLLTRLSGRYTHVTLHHLMDTVDLNDLGIRFPFAYRVAGSVATKMLLLSSSVSVLMPRYRKILFEKYGGANVHVRAHGILTHSPQYPDLSRRGNPVHRILAFGKWGTYKRLELMIQAFGLIADRFPEVTLVIAGGNHPQAPGYVQSVERVYGAQPGIEFRGYISEDEMENLFQSSSALVMPYSSSTGSSGVAHQACAYGVPILCADLEDFRQMAAEEELAIEFFRTGDANDLADHLSALLQNPARLRLMALQNFSSALRMTMPSIVRKYLRHFEVQRQLETRRRLAKLRRLPDWLPSRALFLRSITRKASNWVDRSLMFLPQSDRRESPEMLQDSESDDRRPKQLGSPRTGDRVRMRIVGSPTRTVTNGDSSRPHESADISSSTVERLSGNSRQKRTPHASDSDVSM